MGATVAARVVQAEGKTLTPQLPLVGEARRPVPEGATVAERGRWILPIVARSIDRVMSRKEAAILLGVSEPVLSRYVKGEDDKSLSLIKLGALGDRFWVALRDELAIYFDLNDPNAEIAQATDLISRGISVLLRRAK